MPAPSPSSAESTRRPRRNWAGRVCLSLLVAALIWSLPRPAWVDVAAPDSGDSNGNGRWSFRSARRLVEVAGKGSAADDTELSGPCWDDDGQTLYFTRSRPGVRADIVRSHRTGERWSRPEPVRELNSVDEDRRATISASGRSLVLASNRSGTRGGFDLWESTSANGNWRKPKNAGAIINTAADEFDPALSSDGLMLLFVRRESGGAAEVFLSRRKKVSASWSPPQPVASANALGGDILSPTFAAEDRYVWFVVRRNTLTASRDRAELFQAPLSNGEVGEPTRVADAVAAGGSIADPAVSADGQMLIFASSREGASQLYESQAEWVVSRLSITATHLDRFGKAKWWLPIGLAVCSLVAMRIRRRSNTGTVTADSRSRLRSPSQTANKIETADRIDQPVRRSAPPVNPLANWPTSASATPTQPNRSPSSESTSRRELPTTQRAASGRTASHVAKREEIPAPRRHRGQSVIATLSLAALLFVGIRTRDRWLATSVEFVPRDVSQFDRLRDITAPTRGELQPLARSNTSRETAPELGGFTIEAASLRQGARWPADMVVVRVPSPYFVAVVANPDLTGVTKSTPLTRSSLVAMSVRAQAGFVEPAPFEPFTLAATEMTPETPPLAASVIVDRAATAPPIVALQNTFAASGWSVTMPSPARMSLTPDEIGTRTPPTVELAWSRSGRFVMTRDNVPSAVAAEYESAPPMPQTLSELSVEVTETNIARSPAAEIGSAPALDRMASANSVVTPKLAADLESSIAGQQSSELASLAARQSIIERRSPRDVGAFDVAPEPISLEAGSPGSAIQLVSAQSLVEVLPAAPLALLVRSETIASSGKPAESAASVKTSGLPFPLAFAASYAGWPEVNRPSSSASTPLSRRTNEGGAAVIPEAVAPIFE